MRHDLELCNTCRPLIERLDDIRMSEGERRTAIVYMRRGERVADCVLAFGRLVTRFAAASSRRVAIAGYALRKLLRGKPPGSRRARTRADARIT